MIHSRAMSVATGTAIYLRHLHLKNVRDFAVLDLPFAEPRDKPRRRTVIIGRNGTCKSTILRCIALGLASPADAAGLLAEPVGGFIGPRASTAIIEVRGATQDGRPFRIRTELAGTRGEETVAARRLDGPGAKVAEGGALVCGYGSGRSTLGSKGIPGRERYRVYDSVLSLFRYEESLLLPELVLRRLASLLKPSDLQHVMVGIKRALRLRPEEDIRLSRHGVEIVTGKHRRIPFDGWADGYRLTFGWMLDLYGWAMTARCLARDGDVRGILLVDEIEQHLHPSMQVAMLAHLAATLPNVQIVATTHSPQIPLSARAEEIVALHRRGDVIVSAPVPPLEGFSAEDLLTDEDLFDTPAYGPGTTQVQEQYRRLASKPAAKRTPAERDALSSLASKLRVGVEVRQADDPVLAKLEEIGSLLEGRAK